MAGLFEGREERLLGDLNAAQRAAVTHGRDGPAGPLIVLAGPGTGKTRVLTRRVAWLVERGANPEHVLALTFTRKAAGELRERLVELIGPRADAVRAMTFHAFGQSLIRRFSDMMDLPREITLIDSAVERRVLRELVHRHGLFTHLLAIGRETALNEAARTIAKMGEALLTPRAAMERAAEWAQRLERGELDPRVKQKKDETDDDALVAERERQRMFAEAARLYGLYRAECGKKGWLTFAELVLRPIELLLANKAAASIVRSEIGHVVVDEFQDNATAQIELLRLVAPPESGPRGEDGRRVGPDVVVVGDDDQAIYEFRGADEMAFGRFESIWTPGRRCAQIRLSENHRSGPAIIAAANAIMARATTRFAPDKTIELPPGKPGETGSVEGVLLGDDAETGSVVAAMILADREVRSHGGVATAWSDYAVIARGWKDIDRVLVVLEAEGIPAKRGKGTPWRNDAGVRDLLAWADALVRGDRSAVQALLVRPPTLIAVERVGTLARGYIEDLRRRKLSGAAEADGASIDEAAGLVAWVRARATGDEAARVARFGDVWDGLRERVADASAWEALHAIVEQAGLAHGELLPAMERAKRIGALARVLRLARDVEGLIERPGDLAAFLRYIDDLEDKAEGGLAAEDEMHPGAEGENGGDLVRLETAHGAKGLEFDTVFVPRVRSQHGYPTKRGLELPAVPRWMVEDSGGGLSDEERRDAEERRVFYVACTRAKRRLVLLAESRAEKTQLDRDKRGEFDFFDELTRTAAGGSVPTSTTAEVMERAGRVGVRIGGEALLDDAAGVSRAQAGQRRAAMLERVRMESRRIAAAALDVVDRVGVGTNELAEAERTLSEAARRLALAHDVLRGSGTPDWARSATGALGALIPRLEAMVRVGEAEPGGVVFAPRPAPLQLSYSSIDQFKRCGWCWYLKNVLKWVEAESSALAIGTLVHDTLRDYHEQAKREGTWGTRERLLAMCRERFFSEAGSMSHRSSGAATLEAALAQLDLYHGKLLDHSDEVEAVETTIRFAYRLGKHVHSFQAKIDRLDRWPSGGHRIVDFKTGRASKKLVEPKDDDLQLGIYALALKVHQGLELDDTEQAMGVAEYWALSTGQRGRIALADLNMAKVRKQIDEVIGKMLRGEYARASGCDGPCRVLGPE